MLRPLEIKHLFDFTIRLYRSRFSSMFLAMALVHLPLALLTMPPILWITRVLQETQGAAMRGESAETMFLDNIDMLYLHGGLLLVALAYQLLAAPLGYLACSKLAWQSLMGEHWDLRRCFAHALRRYWPTQVAIATFLLPLLALALLVLLPVLAFSVGGSAGAVAGSAGLAILLIFFASLATLLAFFRYFPALFGIVQAAEEPEADGVVGQGLWYLKRAYGITEGYFFRLFGLIILLGFATGIVERGITDAMRYLYLIIHAINTHERQSAEQVFQALFTPDTAQLGVVMVGGSVVDLVFPALSLCFLLLLYFDLRCRKEGLDLLRLLEPQPS